MRPFKSAKFLLFRDCIRSVQDSVLESLFEQLCYEIDSVEAVKENSQRIVKISIDLVQYSWERIHCCHWKNVNTIYRDAYACAVLVFIYTISCRNKDQSMQFYSQLVQCADKALLLGYKYWVSDLQNLIHRFEQHVQDIIQQEHVCSTTNIYFQAVKLPTYPGDIFQHKRIVRHGEVDLCRFYAEHLLLHHPVVLTDCMDCWPAVSASGRRWADLSYLRKACGLRTVPIEIGSSYLAEDSSQELMTISDFIDTFIMKKHLKVRDVAQAQLDDGCLHDAVITLLQESDDVSHNGGKKRKSAATASKSVLESASILSFEIGYLAQHQLFRQIPRLRRDIVVPDYCALLGPDDEAELTRLQTEESIRLDVIAASATAHQPVTAEVGARAVQVEGEEFHNQTIATGTLQQDHVGDSASGSENDWQDTGDEDDVLMHAWFGPPGTVSPLHHDPYHNLLAQVAGYKYVRLFNADQSDKLYPMEGRMYNNSAVDLLAGECDAARYPAIAEAIFSDTVLRPGDMLFIPRHCWHWVAAIDEASARAWLRKHEGMGDAAFESHKRRFVDGEGDWRHGDLDKKEIIEAAVARDSDSGGTGTGTGDTRNKRSRVEDAATGNCAVSSSVSSSAEGGSEDCLGQPPEFGFSVSFWWGPRIEKLPAVAAAAAASEGAVTGLHKTADKAVPKSCDRYLF